MKYISTGAWVWLPELLKKSYNKNKTIKNWNPLATTNIYWGAINSTVLPIFYICAKSSTKILSWPLIEEDTYHLNTWVARWFVLDIYNFQPLFSPSAVIKTQSITYEKFVIISFNPLSANFTKWSNTQTIRWKTADDLFECVWPFCGIGA